MAVAFCFCGLVRTIRRRKRNRWPENDVPRYVAAIQDQARRTFMPHLFEASPEFVLFFFLTISAVALFTFLSIATWTGTRQAEREAYYRADMLKKIAELGADRSPALDYLREQERIKAAKRLGSLKLGGLMNVAIGLGLMIMLKAMVPHRPVFMVGTIELFIGFALLAYAFWLAPERQAEASLATRDHLPPS
jgi:hypothetical protein